MAGNMTASKTLGGSSFADVLTGGSSGYDFGLSQTADTAPQANVYYLRQDGAQKITQLSVNVQAYTGTYGGDYSASADLTKLVAHGDANVGLQVDLVWNDAGAFTTKTTFKTGVGASFANRVLLPTTVFAYNNAGTLQAPITPVAGYQGASGDSTLGDTARMWFRYLSPGGETQLGKRQFDIYFSFNFTT